MNATRRLPADRCRFGRLTQLAQYASNPSFERDLHLLHTGCATDTRTQAQPFCQPFAHLREFCKLSSTDPNQHWSDFYAVENTVRKGIYPGRIVSEHGSHWQAVSEMLRLNAYAKSQQPDTITDHSGQFGARM